MRTNYQKFLSVLAKWPINSEKKSRDYAFHLRMLLKKQTSEGNFFPGKPADTPKMLDSLLRLSENKYGLKYPGTFQSGASGMVKEDVAVVLSDEFIKYFNSRRGFF